MAMNVWLKFILYTQPAQPSHTAQHGKRFTRKKAIPTASSASDSLCCGKQLDKKVHFLLPLWHFLPSQSWCVGQTSTHIVRLQFKKDANLLFRNSKDHLMYWKTCDCDWIEKQTSPVTLQLWTRLCTGVFYFRTSLSWNEMIYFCLSTVQLGYIRRISPSLHYCALLLSFRLASADLRNG